MWVERQPKVQSSFQKLNVDNSCQKTRKIRYYIFEILSSFTVLCNFFTLCQIFCVGLSEEINFGRNLAQSPFHLNFWIFSVSSKHFSNDDVDLKQLSCVKSSKFYGFVLPLFCILGLGQSLTLENFQLCILVVFSTN